MPLRYKVKKMERTFVTEIDNIAKVQEIEKWKQKILVTETDNTADIDKEKMEKKKV